MNGSGDNLRGLTGREARAHIRSGGFAGPTTGMAAGFVQANLVIVPERFALDFLRFCQLNPKPCPLLGVGEPGDPALPAVGEGIDIRTDVPRYRVFRDGAFGETVENVSAIWRDDLVTFALGCSFSFEHALVDYGLTLKHSALDRNVAMYRTSLETVPSGPFGGPLVVSMRPFRGGDAVRAVQISTRYPMAHGAPVHLGAPQAIGIADLARPDFGDAVPVEDDEIPVFWACGVTPQAALERAGLAFAITHDPGHMLVTDIRNEDIALL